MVEKQRIIHADIGGGTHPDFFINRAQQDPNGLYIVLDPTSRDVAAKPSNLYLVQWQQDEHSSLPLGDGSVTEAYMNNLYGELRTGGRALDWSTEEVFDSVDFSSGYIDIEAVHRRLYEQLIISLKRVLQKDGKVHVIDSRENIFTIAELLALHNYDVSAMREVADTNKTLWTAWYGRVATDLGEDGRDAMPMELCATLRT